MSLEPKVKSRVRELIDLETEKALLSGEFDYASELQEAKNIVAREANKLRHENPYISFMGECMLEGDGDPRERMKACAAKWNEKSKEKKENLKKKKDSQEAQ